MAELRRAFRPEFLNRIDDTVLFKPLGLEEITRIVDLLLADLNKRLADRHIVIELDKKASEWVAEKGYDPVYGARPLKRFLQKHLENRLAHALIAGEVQNNSTVPGFSQLSALQSILGEREDGSLSGPAFDAPVA
jgi:ATP-dependent Clp protease ATP-binding subunit ClpB